MSNRSSDEKVGNETAVERIVPNGADDSLELLQAHQKNLELIPGLSAGLSYTFR
jgi:hypothetical protein